jgi:hypothetical protein
LFFRFPEVAGFSRILYDGFPGRNTASTFRLFSDRFHEFSRRNWAKRYWKDAVFVGIRPYSEAGTNDLGRQLLDEENV